MLPDKAKSNRTKKVHSITLRLQFTPALLHICLPIRRVPILQLIFILDVQTGSADKDTPYDPRDPRPEWPYVPTDQATPAPSRPEQYKAAVGDRTKISCQIENQNTRTSWRRQDGGPLPRNSFLSGGDLIIEYTQEDAAGVYECVVHEPNGDYPIVTTELVVVGKSWLTQIYCSLPNPQQRCLFISSIRIATNHIATIDAIDGANW